VKSLAVGLGWDPDKQKARTNGPGLLLLTL